MHIWITAILFFSLSYVLLYADAQRAVYPLIIDGLAPNGARPRADLVADAPNQPSQPRPGPADPQKPSKSKSKSTSAENQTKDKHGEKDGGKSSKSKSQENKSKSKEKEKVKDMKSTNSNLNSPDKFRITVAENSRYVKTSAGTTTCKQQDDCYSLREPNEWCRLPPSDRYFEKGCFCDHASGKCVIERQAADGTIHTDCTAKASSDCLNGHGGGKSGVDIQFSESQKSDAALDSNGQEAPNHDDSPKPSEVKYGTKTQKGNGDDNGREGSKGHSEVDSEGVPAKNQLIVAGLKISPKSVFTKTSGTEKSCEDHRSCYAMREPEEWCPLPPTDRYYEKGCFCNFDTGKCVIERETAFGSEYTDCVEKTVISKCQAKNTTRR